MVNGLSDIYLSTSVVKSESTGDFAASPSERRTDSARELRVVGDEHRIGLADQAFGSTSLRKKERAMRFSRSLFPESLAPPIMDPWNVPLSK